MKPWLFLLAGFLLYGCSTVQEPVRTQLLYNGHLFVLPDNIFIIAPTASPDNRLILKYGPDQGKKYLAFSRLNHNGEIDLGCSQADFFAALFTRQNETGCGQEQLDVFRKAFVDARDSGVWHGSQLTVYFSVGAKKSFLFAFDKTGLPIMIDTDFLSKTALQRMIDSAL